jgi:hypothetical protein
MKQPAKRKQVEPSGTSILTSSSAFRFQAGTINPKME